MSRIDIIFGQDLPGSCNRSRNPFLGRPCQSQDPAAPYTQAEGGQGYMEMRWWEACLPLHFFCFCCCCCCCYCCGRREFILSLAVWNVNQIRVEVFQWWLVKSTRSPLHPVGLSPQGSGIPCERWIHSTKGTEEHGISRDFSSGSRMAKVKVAGTETSPVTWKWFSDVSWVFWLCFFSPLDFLYF